MLQSLLNIGIICIIAFNSIQAQVKTVKLDSVPYHYVVYLPEGYDSSKTLYPSILFLHGRSIQGTDVEKVKSYGVIYEIINGLKLDFVVVAPQCQSGWDNKKLMQLMRHVQSTYKVDSCRSYLTGMSMGGYGAWYLAGEYPKQFAAVAPVCGGGNLKDVDRLASTPLWVFHGAKDRAVPISESEKMVTELKKKKENQVQFTIYPNWGHSELVHVFKLRELYDWFLKYERG